MAAVLAVCGAGIGAGLLLILTGLVPVPPALVSAVAALHSTAPTAAATAGARLVEILALPFRAVGLPSERTRADLAICDRDPTRFLAGQVGLAALGLLLPAAAAAAISLAGAGISWTLPLWTGLPVAAAAITVSYANLRDRTQQRRLSMLQTLNALLQVIPPALAAGAGIEQAFTDATKTANGWAADRIRHALAAARLTRVPIWQPLHDLGAECGVIELQQLAGTLRLASGEGTRIRHALTQRGTGLSQRLATDLEAQAEAATERLSIPLMALTGLFLLFLIYPALTAITT